MKDVLKGILSHRLEGREEVWSQQHLMRILYDFKVTFHYSHQLTKFLVYLPENLRKRPLKFRRPNIFGQKMSLSSAAWSCGEKNCEGEKEAEWRTHL